MRTTCKDIAAFMETLAPQWLAEDWDNVGLLVGDRDKEIHKIMLTLDVTGTGVEYAVEQGVDLIVSHHPVIFTKLKKITCDDFKGRLLYTLIQNGIGVFSAHTNLDTTREGINHHLANLLQLQEVQDLKPYKTGKLYKLVVFVPAGHAEAVRTAICSQGAGHIGNYDFCTFHTEGTGTFRPDQNTNPFIGQAGKLEEVKEVRIETIVPAAILKQVLQAMLQAHPYEEVAYDVYPLEHPAAVWGLGKVGMLSQSMPASKLAEQVKASLQASAVRLVGDESRMVEKAAVFCGSFDDDLTSIAASGAQVLIVGEAKYHTALDAAQMGITVIEAGHYNTEKIILRPLQSTLKEAFPHLEVCMNNMETDPFKYY